MKIDHSFKSIKTDATVETKKVSRGSGDKKGGSTGSTEVQLSPLMSHLKETEANLTQTPSFDQARVDEIRAAIASGQFKINPEAIADRLLETMGEWIGTPS